MTSRILVVDRNRSFAAMLREVLETEGGYNVVATHTGSGALALLSKDSFDLAIIDMDLDPDDLGYQELLASVQQVAPHTRLILIPLLGSSPPSELPGLNIQGVLSKPFFIDDLLPSVGTALAEPVEITTPLVEKEPPSDQHSSQVPERLQAALAELSHELNADAILFLSRDRGGDPVIAQHSSMNGARLRSLANLCLKMLNASRAAASFFGQPEGNVVHNMFEDEKRRLYMVGLPDGKLLVVSTPASTSLGTIRHTIRRTLRHLYETGPR
jgi:CheY-like chemotaxis protein